MYGESQTTLEWHGTPITITQVTDYPLCGEVIIKITTPAPITGTLALHNLAWSHETKLTFNGQSVSLAVKDGYLYLQQTFNDGNQIQLRLDMTAKKFIAIPKSLKILAKWRLPVDPRFNWLRKPTTVLT